MLLERNALFKSKVFLLISSAVVGDKNNVFFVTKDLKVFLALGIFLSSFPAIDVKKLLKWFAMIKLSEVVLLSIFKVI